VQKNHYLDGMMLEDPFYQALARDTEDSSWMLSLSDLMSLLLIFFLVWTTLNIADQKNKGSVPEVSQSQMNFSAAQDPLNGLKDSLLEFSPETTADGNIVIVLTEDLSFDSNSAVLTLNAEKILKRIASKLKTGNHYRLRILGHTDNQPVGSGGPWTSNFDLSYHRAAAVATSLISFGISPGRITCQAFGDLYPAQDNKNPEKRRFNRRVEIVIEPVN